MNEQVQAADAAVTGTDVTPETQERSVRILNVATRIINKGDEDLPPTTQGEPNDAERLRLLKSMSPAERLEWRANGDVVSVLLARRRAGELLELNPRDEVAMGVRSLLTEVAERLLRA